VSEDQNVVLTKRNFFILDTVPGLCVSLPVYYATGNRCQAFAWGCLSGISEPIAALLGWAVLANNFSNEMFGVMFGIVSDVPQECRRETDLFFLVANEWFLLFDGPSSCRLQA
jgi:hypothetical protein